MPVKPHTDFLVLGAHGQLAQEFLKVLGPRAVGLDRGQLVLGDLPSTAAAVARFRPRVVVNCAAYNRVDLAESQHALALAANAVGPAQLAALAVRHGFRLVHFSTDYVFGADGLQRPRTEEDEPAPLNFYGYSKLLGEEAVLEAGAAALVLRVAHLFGGRSLSPGRANLVDRFCQLARSGQPIAITEGQFLNPTSVCDIVVATLALLAISAHGLFHLTGEGECSAENFAREVCRLAGLPAQVRLVGGDNRPAIRPRYTVLANLRLAQLGLPPLPRWQVSLAQYICASGSAQS